MTVEDAIKALKLINLDRVHPFLHWEEMIEVRDMAIAALCAQRKAEEKHRTIADRIRAMSDEEMATWLTDFSSEAFAAGALKFAKSLMTESERLAWLKLPVEK